MSSVYEDLLVSLNVTCVSYDAPRFQIIDQIVKKVLFHMNYSSSERSRGDSTDARRDGVIRPDTDMGADVLAEAAKIVEAAEQIIGVRVLGHTLDDVAPQGSYAIASIFEEAAREFWGGRRRVLQEAFLRGVLRTKRPAVADYFLRRGRRQFASVMCPREWYEQLVARARRRRLDRLKARRRQKAGQKR